MARETTAAQIPDLTDPSPAGIRAWARQVRSALGRVTGQTATTSNAALDQAVTFRTLIDAGFAVAAPAGHAYPVLPGNDPGLSVTSPPPAPTTFRVTRLAYNMRLTWDAPLYGNHKLTEVWRASANNLSLAVKIFDVPDGTTLYEDGFIQGSASYYWIRFVSLADVPGGFNAITGTADTTQPGDVTGLSYSMEGFGIRLRWNGISDQDVDVYELRLGATWAAATLIDQVKGTSYLWPVRTAGTYRVWLAARNAAKLYSGSPIAQDVTVAAPGSVAVASSITADTLTLSWAAVLGAFLIDDYEVRQGTDWAAGTFVARVLATQYQTGANWSGSRRYLVAARDVAGNYGPAGAVDVAINLPGIVQSVRADVVDNNVLLYWAAPATGSLPVATYEVRRGVAFSGSQLIGEKSGLFTSVFEQSSGSYTYWLRAKDTAGNYGPEASVSTKVNQPPDFVLYSDQNMTLSAGTRSNAYLMADGTVVLPYDTTQTYDASFTASGWTTNQDAITAGATYYAQPAPSTGYIEFVVSYGVSIPSTSVTVTPTYDSVGGTPSVAATISYSSDGGTTYSSASNGFTLFIPSPFNTLKVRLTVTSTGLPFAILRALNIKLNTKQRTLSGQGTGNAADSGGTRFVLTQDGTDFAITGNNSSGSAVLTGLSSTANLARLMSVEGTGIQSGSVIQSVDSASQVTLSKVTTAGTTGGTYRFGMSAFVDLIGPPTVQPAGTTPIIPVVDFVDDYAPLSFKVLLFNTSGTRVTAAISWTGRGV